MNYMEKIMLRFKTFFVCIIPIICQIAFLSNLAQAQPDSGENKIALVGGTLIDGSGAPAIENSVLLIDGNRIAAVGQQGSLLIPQDYTVISTEGRTVMPGLWDMHVHLLYAGHSNFPYWHRTYTDQFTDTIMPATALQLLQSGVTSARDLGAPPESIFRIKEQIDSNEIPGPTMYVAGPQLTPQPPDWGIYYRRNISGNGNAETEAMRLVEREANVLKISNAEGLRIEEVRAVTDIAHDHGLLVTAHGRSDAEIEIGLAGGIDEFQHIGTASESYPESLINQISSITRSGGNLYWTPTVGLQLRAGTASADRELLDDPENYQGLPPEIIQDIKNSLANYDPDPAPADTIKRKVRQLQDAGVTLLVGTDGGLSGNPHAQSMWQEMLAWVEELGIDPLQTIHAATALPAKVLGVDDVVGSLEQGKIADIIVVHGDPLINMGVLSDPELVIKNGQIMFDSR
jgi:imidazolonepropionase-like amidohydrolase